MDYVRLPFARSSYMIPKACTRWEFPEVRGTLFWGLDNKDYLGYYIRVPYCRKLGNRQP